MMCGAPWAGVGTAQFASHGEFARCEGCWGGVASSGGVVVKSRTWEAVARQVRRREHAARDGDVSCSSEAMCVACDFYGSRVVMGVERCS